MGLILYDDLYSSSLTEEGGYLKNLRFCFNFIEIHKQINID